MNNTRINGALNAVDQPRAGLGWGLGGWGFARVQGEGGGVKGLTEGRIFPNC